VSADTGPMSRRVLLVIVGICGAIALAGCGVASTIGSVVNPVALAATVSRAAQRTGVVSGYRVHATLAIENGLTTTFVSESGALNTLTGVESEVEDVRVGRRKLREHALYRGGTVYLRVRGLPGGSQLGQGHAWIAMNESRAFGYSTPSVGYDPAEFVNFLRTPGTTVKPMGQESIDGVPTTLYRTFIDLDRYARAQPRRLRRAAADTVSFVERAAGTHTLQEDVWVDSSGLIRQYSWGITECVDGQTMTTSMLGDISDFGPQPSPVVPRPSATRDLTPQLTAAVKQLKDVPAGCSQSQQS
jgi:hypothetical protein